MSSAPVAVLRAAGLQYARQPINIALFLILPPLFVLALGAAMGTFSDVLGGNLTERTATALAALWAASLLGGSASFFLIGASRRADERLLIAGLRPGVLESAHALGGLVLAVVAGSIGFGFVMATNEIASPAHAWAAIVLGALAYEGVGVVLAFGIRGDLEGSFVIILLFMFDAFVAGPLGGASGFWPNLFPLHHPSQLVVDAAVNADVDGSRYVWSIAYTLLLLGIGGLAHRRRSG